MIKGLITLLFLPFYMVILVFKIVFLPFTILFGGSKKSNKKSDRGYSDGFDDGLLAGWFLFDDWD